MALTSNIRPTTASLTPPNLTPPHRHLFGNPPTRNVPVFTFRATPRSRSSSTAQHSYSKGALKNTAAAHTLRAQTGNTQQRLYHPHCTNAHISHRPAKPRSTTHESRRAELVAAPSGTLPNDKNTP